jgi:type II secretory pathway pseudopilin PulG
LEKWRLPFPGPRPSWVLMIIAAFYLLILLYLIFIPPFMRFLAQSKDAEAKTNLGAIYTQQIEYRDGNGKFARSAPGKSVFELIDWEPQGQNRYRYYCDQDMIINMQGGNSRMFPEPDNWPFSIRPETSDSGFTCLAAGNIDQDLAPDMWMINDQKLLTHLISDGDNVIMDPQLEITDAEYKKLMNSTLFLPWFYRRKNIMFLAYSLSIPVWFWLMNQDIIRVRRAWKRWLANAQAMRQDHQGGG